MTARTLTGAGHARTLITVADSGEGISAGSRETVFRSFHREGDANPSSGIGLGLSVVRGFVEAMGGTVSIDETPGGGTTVEVDLPAGGETTERVGAELVTGTEPVPRPEPVPQPPVPQPVTGRDGERTP